MLQGSQSLKSFAPSSDNARSPTLLQPDQFVLLWKDTHTQVDQPG